MLDVLQRCFPDRIAEWTPQLKRMVPTYGKKLSDDPSLAGKTLDATAHVLEITEPEAAPQPQLVKKKQKVAISA